MNKITKYLNQHINGQVFDRPSILRAYSRDKSVIEVNPRLVAIPYDTDDIQFLLRFANDIAKKGFKLPVAVRGSGQSKTGACLSEGMVISTEKLNKVQEVDEHDRLVRVQAGVTLEKLNAVLAAYNLCLPVKADENETIGGLISTFPTDPFAKKYGSIFYFVDRLEAVLSNGELVQTISYTKSGLKNAQKPDNLEGKVYRELDELIDKEKDLIDNFGNMVHSRAGYSMITQVKKDDGRTFDLLPLFFGAEGTLGVITEVILRVEPIPRAGKNVLAEFPTLDKATEYMKKVSTLDPATLDVFDARIFKIAASHGKNLGLLEPIPEKGYYVLVNFKDSFLTAGKKLRQCLGIGANATSITAETDINADDFKEIYTLVDCYLNDENSMERPSLVDEFSVDPDNLVKFVKELSKIEKALSQELPLFGSFATSVYTVRPDFDLSDVAERKRAMQFLRYFGKIIKECGGSFTGGRSEGRVKGLVSTSEMSKREAELYRNVKKIFDPNDYMNPETKLGANFADVVRHLRTSENQGVK
ncbi:FAD-binding oxidoreductase [Candidatus Saccharibacteria bacterium]|nr:FAD-binding oxidoreductase [Candidatus Saccharibacteria bacterium]